MKHRQSESKLRRLGEQRKKRFHKRAKRHRQKLLDWLHELGFANYQQYLASPLYKEIRAKVFELKGDSCVRRGCPNKARELHHAEYSLDVLAGRDLAPIHPACPECHRASHKFGLNGRTLKMANRFLGLNG